MLPSAGGGGAAPSAAGGAPSAGAGGVVPTFCKNNLLSLSERRELMQNMI